MAEGLIEVEKRVRADLEKAGLDQETIVLLEEAAKIVEDLERRGFTHLNQQSFRLGILLTKISERIKEKGGDDGKRSSLLG